MTFQRKAIWASVAILIVLTLVLPSIATAQARGGGRHDEADGAAPGAGRGVVAGLDERGVCHTPMSSTRMNAGNVAPALNVTAPVPVDRMADTL